MKERGEEITDNTFLLPHEKTFLPRDTEAVEVSDLQAPGRVSRERPRLVKHQELPTRSTLSYEFSNSTMYLGSQVRGNS